MHAATILINVDDDLRLTLVATFTRLILQHDYYVVISYIYYTNINKKNS